MAEEISAPATFDDAKRLPGARVPSEEEFDEFMKNIPDHPLLRNLVNCTVPENDGQKCFASGCYQNQRVVVYCRAGLCQDRVFLRC